MVEQEERLEALIVKLGLVGSALSNVHLPADEDDKAENEDETRELDMLGKLEGPSLRTITWALMDDITDLRVQAQLDKDMHQRAEAERAAVAQKLQKTERELADLKKHLASRITNIEKDRIQYAQALCSPVGKYQRSHVTPQKGGSDDVGEDGEDPTAVLRTLNAELEVRGRRAFLCGGGGC